MTAYDLAVVGAGIAGLTAANRAAELGCRVVVLEKGDGDHYPCNSRIATGVLNVAHTDPHSDAKVLRQEPKVRSQVNLSARAHEQRQHLLSMHR